MDPLSDVLRVAQLTGGAFLHAEFSAPWCMAARVDPAHCAPFLGPAAHLIPYHYVVSGELMVQVGEEPQFRVAAGEVVLFPGNDSHLLGSDLTLPPSLGSDVIKPPEGDGLATLRLGGDGERATVICGFLASTSADDNPILATLPPSLHLPVDQSGVGEWVRSTFQFAANEVAAGNPGSGAVLSKLSELLFVEAIRRYVSSLPPGSRGWLAGLQDPYVSKALSKIHGAVARSWTVEALGREIGLSRSALADRFLRTVGVSPMQYVAHWRIQVAKFRLRTTQWPMIDIAEEIGYESESAFSRAFKKLVGKPPAKWRREVNR